MEISEIILYAIVLLLQIIMQDQKYYHIFKYCVEKVYLIDFEFVSTWLKNEKTLNKKKKNLWLCYIIESLIKVR